MTEIYGLPSGEICLFDDLIKRTNKFSDTNPNKPEGLSEVNVFAFNVY